MLQQSDYIHSWPVVLPPLGDSISGDPLEHTMKTGGVEEQPDQAEPFHSEEAENKAFVKNKKSTKSHARKRAKIESTSSSSGVNGKKNLSLLPTMPLDILFEILGLLSPKDILNISRVSKIFRGTLMSRTAKTIWKAARDRIGAPDCPTWMSEPAWAALLIGHFCQSCGTTNVHKVDFILLKRVCASCKKIHLLIGSKAARRYQGILDLVPSTNISPWANGYSSTNNYYWDADLQGMAERILKFETDVKENVPNSQKRLLDFKEEHRQRITQIQQNSLQWRAWSCAVQLERDQEKRAAQNRRLEQIKEKFRELGYLNEDLSCLTTLKECCFITPLTQLGWTRARPRLEPHVMGLKARRLKREAATVQRNRRNIIFLRYQEYKRTLHPSQWKYLPSTLKLFSYEPFARHIDVPVEVGVTPATFDDAFARLPELLAISMHDRKNSLRDLLPKGLHEDGDSGARRDLIDLATATFRCKAGCPYLFGWDDIASHQCEEQPFDDTDLEWRSGFPEVDYCPLASIVLKKVAKVMGFQCVSMTAADLDQEDQRFSCDSCMSYKQGGKHYEAAYNWRTLVDHLVAGHNPNLSITILPNKEAEEVRRIERQMKRKTWKWTCTHCPEHLDNLQSYEAVLEHLRDSHAIVIVHESTDLLFCERDTRQSPDFTVRKAPDPAPLFRCLLCRNTHPSYILPNIEAHLKQIHQVVDAVIGQDFVASSRTLEQPLSSVASVKYWSQNL